MSEEPDRAYIDWRNHNGYAYDATKYSSEIGPAYIRADRIEELEAKLAKAERKGE